LQGINEQDKDFEIILILIIKKGMTHTALNADQQKKTIAELTNKLYELERELKLKGTVAMFYTQMQYDNQ
jgi:hypothetical protein